jgi:CDP-paratose 2-epimerase
LLSNKIKNFKVDISKSNKLSKIKFRPDIIIDCAAEPAVELSFKYPEKIIHNNFLTTLNLLNFAKKNKSKIIFISSSRIYPIKKSYDFFKTKKNKFNENTNSKGPKTIYGFSKFSSEMLIEEYAYLYNLKFIINRLGLTSGPWQFGRVEQGLVSLWIWKHFKNKKLKYIGFGGSGNQIRDVLDINDLCKLISIQVQKFNKIFNQTFCVGGGKENSFNLKKLTSYCQDITKKKINIGKDPKTSINDIPYYVSSNRKLRKFYNWSIKVGFKETLEKTYQWMLVNEKKIKNFF